MVYANATSSALSQSNSSLMLIDLAGGNLHLVWRLAIAYAFAASS
jgi:hypothetical protein